jgi:hypothetical protein
MSLDMNQMIRDFGFPVALVAFFVWWSWVREQRLSKRLERLEDWTRDKLIDIVQDNTEAMRAIGDKPCMNQKTSTDK